MSTQDPPTGAGRHSSSRPADDEPRPRQIPIEQLRHMGTLADLVASMPSGDPRYALFLGAGASVSSGIPAAGTLVSWWRRRVYLDTEMRLAWDATAQVAFREWLRESYPAWRRAWMDRFGRQPSEYALLFSYVCPDVDARQGYIENLVSGCEPGPGYIYLSSLVLAGYFHTFLTTNFDDLIHDSLFRYGGLKPAVSAFDSQVASIRLQGPRPKILKLHGDFLFNNIRNIGNEVSRLDQNMQEKFERTCESYGLIVIGYGGQDQSVMAPLRNMVHRRDRLNHGLHWCVRQEMGSNNEPLGHAVVPEELFRMWQDYPDKVHIYVINSFDGAMEGFYEACRCAPPPELDRPEEKALYVRLRDGLANAGQTWRVSEHFAGLLQRFRNATANSPTKESLDLDKADDSCRKGNKAKKERKFDEALRLLREAIELAEKTFGALTAKAIQGPGKVQGPEQASEIRGHMRAIDCQRVHASRRISGAYASVAEAYIRKGTPSDMEAAEVRRALIRAAIDSALKSIAEGQRIDRILESPPELRGHRLNLCYNGLEVFAFKIASREGLTPNDILLAQSFLQAVSSDICFGDEFIEEIHGDPGGPELLALLDSSRKAAGTEPDVSPGVLTDARAEAPGHRPTRVESTPEGGSQ